MRSTHRPLTLVAVLLSLFMSAIEMTVVSTAMPTVVGDLGGVRFYAWVFSAYLLASTVTVPIFGKLADLYGRKPILLIGLGVFSLGSLLCGLSQTMLQLVIFRAVQGLGAGALQPITLTVIGDIYTLEERARVQGFTGAVWGFSGLVGPLVGGAITEWLSWHWIFFLNLPFGILAAGLFVAFFHEEEVEKRRPSFDLAGAGTLTAGLLVLLLATEQRGAGLWPFLLVAVLLWTFLQVEKRAKDPVLPLGLFSQKVIALSSTASTLFGATVLATTTFVPLYVQAVLGGSATDAGRAITPMVLGWPLCSAISGRLIPRIGFRLPIRIGFAASSLATIGMAAFLGRTTSVPLVQGLMFLLGAGLGFANTALVLSVQTSVDWKNRGVATASTLFFRTIGGTVAVGALGSLLFVSLAKVPGASLEATDRLLGAEKGAGLDPQVLANLGAALSSALHGIFWIVAAITVASFLVGLFFPKSAHVSQLGTARASAAPAQEA